MISNLIDLTEKRVFKDDPGDFSYPQGCHEKVPWKKSKTNPKINTSSHQYRDITSSTFTYIYDEINNSIDSISYVTSSLNDISTYYDYVSWPSITVNFTSLNNDSSSTSNISNRQFYVDYACEVREKDIFGFNKPNPDSCKPKRYLVNRTIQNKWLLSREFQHEYLDNYRYSHRIPWNKNPHSLFSYLKNPIDWLRYTPLIGEFFTIDDRFHVSPCREVAPWIWNSSYKNRKNMGLLSVHTEEEILKELERLENEDNVVMPTDNFFVNGMRRANRN